LAFIFERFNHIAKRSKSLAKHSPQNERRAPCYLLPADKPNRLITQGMLNPCTKIENATTANETAMIEPRSGTFTGSANASASASAPRNPPQTRTC
jgi:hypothetical protein